MSDGNEKAPNKSSLGSAIKSRGAIVAAGFAISIIFLVVTLQKIKWDQVQNAFSHGSWLPWLPLAIVAYIIGMFVRGFRLRLLVTGEATLPTLTATNIIGIGYMTNNILPARLGEFVRAAILSERTGLPYALALTVTLLERLLDGIAVLLLFVGGTLFIPVEVWMKTTASIAGIIFSVAIAGVILVALAPQTCLALASRLTMRLTTKWHDKVLALLTQVIRGFGCLRTPMSAFLVFVSSLVVWSFEALMFMFVMPCFGLKMSTLKAAVVMSFTNLGILIPSSPGFVGPYHYCCSQALLAVSSFMGNPTLVTAVRTPPSQLLTEETAISYAVVVHLIFFTITTIWGIIAMASYGLQLGATAALAWEAKPIKALPEEQSKESGHPLSLITSVPASTSQKFVGSPFWQRMCDAFLPYEELALSDQQQNASSERVSAFVIEQLNALPPTLRLLQAIGFTGFRAWVILETLRPFESLPRAKRLKIVNSWAYGQLSLTRKLMRPVRSLALLVFFEDAEIVGCLDKLKEEEMAKAPQNQQSDPSKTAEKSIANPLTAKQKATDVAQDNQ